MSYSGLSALLTLEQSVKGYYECAYFRFVDVVCASIHCELFNRCRDELGSEMKKQFGVIEDGGKSLKPSSSSCTDIIQPMSALLFLWPLILEMRGVLSTSRKRRKRSRRPRSVWRVCR